MNQSQSNLKLAERGALISIVAYLILSAAKLATGHLLHSSSLVADGFNNLSDIISNVALLIGIRMARQPADRDHRFGHWKIEDLASLVTSIIMFYVGFDVLRDTVQKILSRETTVIDPLGAIVGVGSALVMFAVYLYNRTLAKKAQSKALKAAAKDNLSDVVTSLGTSVAIGASALNYPIVDQLVAIVITFFILKTAYDIFIESSFSLSDGFDESLLDKYKAAILELPKVSRVKSQRGRTYGSNIYLDVVIEMNPDLSVYESHAITEEVERLLWETIAAVFRPDHAFDKALLFVSESGSNGKGTFLELLRNLVGRHRVATVSLADFDRAFMPIPLATSFAVLSDENAVGSYLANSQNLKAWITHD